MKMLYYFSEFGIPNADSITKSFSTKPIKNKSKILDYMKKKGIEKCICGLAYDVVTGKLLGNRIIKHDDEYSWTNDIIYYVDKYNLQLQDDFIQHVLNNS